MSQCKKSMLMGPRCELEEGHEGPHKKTYPYEMPMEWTDASQQKLLRGYRLD